MQRLFTDQECLNNFFLCSQSSTVSGSTKQQHCPPPHQQQQWCSYYSFKANWNFKKGKGTNSKKYESAIVKKDKHRKQGNYLKRKQINMESSMTEMIKNIKSLENKFTLCRTDIDKLQDCASQVPKELFSATAKRAGGGRVRTQFFYHFP